MRSSLQRQLTKSLGCVCSESNRPQLNLGVDMTGLVSRSYLKCGDHGTAWTRGGIDG
jgi:hypothetical protein